MKHLREVWIYVVQTCLRVFPFRDETGLVRIGNPDRNSPVLLTCNFQLTVERVKKALEGLDAYLLVANSRGVNVWCAATGGLFTNHDVISALKTSGIQDLVDHHQVVLPQLAATGIEERVVHEKTGWRVSWGPVDARDIPRFVRRGFDKTVEMRTVTFKWPERLEMAVSWSFPMTALVLFGLPWWKEKLAPLVGLIWAIPLLMFMCFPLYRAGLQAPGRGAFLRQFGVGLAFWGVTMTALTGYWSALGELSWTVASRWAAASLIVCMLVCVELMGSTPVYKSGTHEDRRLRVALDTDACEGIGSCEEVCPTDVFDVDRIEGSARLARGEHCVQCGACVVQCPLDALSFVSPEGSVITPETVRKFKLNLLGKRLVKL